MLGLACAANTAHLGWGAPRRARQAMKGLCFMVDVTSTDNDRTTPDTAAPPRRRRAASRPAGPPPEAETPAVAAASDASEVPSRPARKRTAAAKKVTSAAAKATDAGTQGSANSDPTPATKPAKKASARKAPARKSAAKSSEIQADLVDATAESGGTDGGEPPQEPPAKATKRTRSRAPKAATDVPEASIGSGPPESSDTESVATAPAAAPLPLFQPPDPAAAAPTRSRSRRRPAPKDETDAGTSEVADEEIPASQEEPTDDAEGTVEESVNRRRRRRGGRGRGRGSANAAEDAGVTGDSGSSDAEDASAEPQSAESSDADEAGESEEPTEESTSARRRRRRRRKGQDVSGEPDDPAQTVVRVRESRSRTSDVSSIKGSTRLEAQRQRRRDGRDAGRRRAPILSEAEFLARRESVERIMLVRSIDERVQIAVLEDGVLVEHYVDQGTSSSLVGNVYLGRVQNVLPSMEAAFVDIGRGRNAVLYAGEVNWDAAGLDGQPRRIESALKSGDAILVQVTKDPIGQKGARLTSQVSLPGRYLVYVPDGSMTGISRKLPDKERSRLKAILKKVLPEGAGVIIRTAAEGASEEEITRDIERLQSQWEEIQAKHKTASPPSVISAEPDLAIKVIRDIFNEDFTRMVISGSTLRTNVDEYVAAVAPDLAPRIEGWSGSKDLFAEYRIDEQLTKALDRKVWLPSGGSLVIDRTEAMTVVDVNTGRFTGQGGNLEQTVTENNLEAAEEIVRQLRLRDIGGIIVVDFIDMVLESNRDLVLRRLIECLGRDRTKHQVAEVTSLGLVQMTRKRIGQGLLEAFSTTCAACGGRGSHVSLHPTRSSGASSSSADGSSNSSDTGTSTKATPRAAGAGRRKGKGVDPADVVAVSS